MKLVDMPPYAPTLMESTRAIGYSIETAIADIIDNSIAAGATEAAVHFSPSELSPYISVFDNGCGMTPDEIDNAMRYGSQSALTVRSENDLGRFGLGLKTASLSQCRCLTVVSKKDGCLSARRWDIDEVYKSGSWSLLQLEGDEIDAVPQFKETLKTADHGTLVVWEKLDRLLGGTASPEKLMNNQMDYVREHLALVFHRYIAGETGINKLLLTINNLPVEAKDPFLLGKSTTFQDDEKFLIEGHTVRVSAFMLPHISKLSNAEKKDLGGSEGITKGQGFYIYRNKRLLVWGTWFRMHRKDELSKLARIRVDIPNALDHLWTLDIRKSTAIPPDVIKSNLKRIVDRIAEGSKRTWTFRGKKELSDDIAHLWYQAKIRDGVIYNINRDHAFLEMLNDTLDITQKRLLESYLKLVEENLPLSQLYVDLNNDEQINYKREKEAEKEAESLALSILAHIAGDPDRSAQIKALIKTDPFCNFKSVVKLLEKELEGQDD